MTEHNNLIGYVAHTKMWVDTTREHEPAPMQAQVEHDQVVRIEWDAIGILHVYALGPGRVAGRTYFRYTNSSW